MANGNNFALDQTVYYIHDGKIKRGTVLAIKTTQRIDQSKLGQHGNNLCEHVVPGGNQTKILTYHKELNAEDVFSSKEEIINFLSDSVE